MEMTFLLLVLQFLIVFKVTEGKTNSTITNTNSNSKFSKYTHYKTQKRCIQITDLSLLFFFKS